MGNITSDYKLNFRIVYEKAEAQKLLDEAEKIDFYIEECMEDMSNMKARREYSYSANSMTHKEIKFFEVVLENTKDYIPKRLQYDLEDIKLIQLMPSADGGMPHTRPNNLICYPDISQFFNKSTMIHELWHIHQRKYQNFWTDTFMRLGWELWEGDLPAGLEKYRRYNPDTIDSPFWIFKKTWIPIPIFNDISRPNMTDVTIWFYNPSMRTHIRSVPSEISSYFPNLPPSAYEHPREITAYMLAEPEKYKTFPGFIHLIESIGHISIK
jgi:hypothetical protein